MSEMMETFRSTVDLYGDKVLDFMNPSLAGGRSITKHWFLHRTSDSLLVAMAYVGFVLIAPLVVNFTTHLSPRRKSVENAGRLSLREKFTREPILCLQALYNVGQIILCSYMMRLALHEYRTLGYKPVCNTFTNEHYGMAYATHVFYMSKAYDFCDTVFIILRGKWRQLSFLHVYHHLTIFAFYWINSNIGFDGDAYLPIVVNSFVHLVMYSYYLIRTFEIRIPMALKACITKLQMVQFLLMVGQATCLLCYKCAFPERVTIIYIPYIVSLILLFSNFMRHEYSDLKKTKSD